jgi:ribosomal protein S18 acetylase RimI-like enzyme
MHIRPIQSTDIDALVHVINHAYRPSRDRPVGWTHEAQVIQGQRITYQYLHSISTQPEHMILVLEHDSQIQGCVQISQLLAGQASIGLLTVDPFFQTQGAGKQLLAAAEAYARQTWQSEECVMSVLDVRHELIAFYQRRGYELTGRIQPYPMQAGIGVPKIAVQVLELSKLLMQEQV